MRIDYLIKHDINYRTNTAAGKTNNKTGVLSGTDNNNSLKYPSYFAHFSRVSFKANQQGDLELSKNIRSLVDNTVGNIESKVQSGYFASTEEEEKYKKFSDGLTLLADKKPEVCKELTQGDNKTLKKVEKEYDKFYAENLQSLSEVHQGKKQYSQFWVNEKQVGSTPIIDIWNNVLPVKNGDINQILQNTTDENIQKLKEATVMHWFENVALKQDENTAQNSLTESVKLPNVSYGLNGVKERYQKNPLFAELVKLREVDEPEKALRELADKEIALNIQFNDKTSKPFFNPASSGEDKARAFETAFTFVAEKLSNDTPEEVGRTFGVLKEFKESIQESQEKKNPVYAHIGAKKVFNLAKEYWSKEHLPKLMDEDIKKRIFVEKALKTDKSLKELKTYSNMPVDDKYFIAKYYENQKFMEHKDDPMKKMLSDRNILDKSQVIDEITQKVRTDTEVFCSQVDNIGSILKSEDGAEQLASFKVTGKNKDESTDLLTLYLQTMGQHELASDSNINKKAKFLSGLTDEELLLANNKLKKDWAANYLPAKIDKEVEFQAYKTSSDIRMLDELQKINGNLGDIKIKFNDFSLSLGEMVTNLDGFYGKFKDPVGKTLELQQNSNLYLESMSSSIGKLEPQDSKTVLESFKTDGSKYLDILFDSTKDETARKMLEDLKKTIKTADNPNAVINRLENYGTMIAMNTIMGTGRGHNILSLQNNVHALTQSSSIYPLMEHAGASSMTDIPVAHDAIDGSVATGAAAAGVKAGLLNPYTAVVAAAGIGLYGVYKASKVHKHFPDMYFGETGEQ